jgi:hypothetical protein
MRNRTSICLTPRFAAGLERSGKPVPQQRLVSCGLNRHMYALAFEAPQLKWSAYSDGA